MTHCFFSQNNIQYIDYKDTELLKRFLGSHSRIASKRKNNISAKKQRELARAIKRARFMGLLPYVSH